LHGAGAGHDHAGHPAEPPAPGGAAVPAEHAVHRLDQVRLVGRLGEHPAGPPGVRQGTGKDVGHPAPRRRAAVEPVPLQLFITTAIWAMTLASAGGVD